MKGLKEKVDQEYCNITNVVVDDFLRALDVCYYLAGVSAPAGSMRFASLCPPPCHRAYLQSKNLQKVLRSLSDVELTETAAERFKDLLARIKDFLARLAMCSSRSSRRTTPRAHSPACRGTCSRATTACSRRCRPASRATGTTRSTSRTCAASLWTATRASASTSHTRRTGTSSSSWARSSRAAQDA